MRLERVTRQMFNRNAPATRDAAHALRILRIQMEQIEDMRDRPPRELPTEEALAFSLSHVAEALEELAWHDLARLAHLERLAVYRQLEAARPGAFDEGLGHTLRSLRENLITLERYEEALPVVDEEQQVWSRLLDALPYARDAANTAQSWRSDILGRLGRTTEALESAATAVTDIEARLTGDEDSSGPYALVHAKSDYAERLAQAGRTEEAAALAAEVADFWRPEATDGPGAAHYVGAMQALARRLTGVGRYEQARITFDEAVRVARHQVETDEWETDGLAGVLKNCSSHLASTGLHRQALAAAEEAVARYRDHVDSTRTAHQRTEDEFTDLKDYVDHPDSAYWDLRREEARTGLRAAELALSSALIDLGIRRHTLGRGDEALAADGEAVAIVRGHLAADPDGCERRLSLALNNKASHLDDMGSHAEALDAANEAVALRTRLAAGDRATYGPRPGLARHTLGVILSNLGRQDEALATSLDVLAAYRRLHTADPRGYAADLAVALADHGRIRSRRGEHAEALAATTESVRLSRPPGDQESDRHSADHALALTTFAEVRLAAHDSLIEAREAAEQAVARYEQLAADQPEAYRQSLAQARSVREQVG